MSADLFCKKLLKSFLLGLVSIFVVFMSVFYAFRLFNAKVLPIYKTFYFLVSTNTHVQASAHETVLQGGAGFLLEENGKSYAVISVYLSQDDAQTVSSSFKEQNTALIAKQVDKLYFLGNKEKKQADTIEYGLNGLYSCMCSLNEEITRLDKGATQQSCTRILDAISQKLLTFAKACEKALQGYTNELISIVDKLREIASGIIYAKDLRYELCSLVDTYLKICDEYAL